SSGLTATFGSKNAGVQTATVSGYTLAGTDAQNYTVAATPITASATISQARITVAGVTVANRTYDATTSASVSSTGSLAGQSGAMSADLVSVNSAALTATFNSKNAGVQTATLSGFTLTGVDAQNYTIASAQSTASATISQAQITVGGIAVGNRTYDATTRATVSSTGSITGQTGAMLGDTVSLSSAALTATFGSKNAGVQTATLTGFALSGVDAQNYTIASAQSTAVGSIDKAQVTVAGVTVANRTYDATTSASVSSTGSLAGQSGAMSADLVSVNSAALTATFNSKNAGVQTATLSGFTLTGVDARNYTIASAQSTASATIAQAQVTLSGVSVGNRTYDATTSATITSGGSISGQTGAMSADALSLASSELRASFGSKNAGLETATLSGVTLTGADARNYHVVVASDPITATISPRQVQAVLGGTVSKTYDGTTHATLGSGNLAVNGVIGGDSVNISGTQAAYDSSAPGSGKLVSVTGLYMDGSDAGNYVLAQPSVSAAVGLITGGPNNSADLSVMAAQAQAQRSHIELFMLNALLVHEQTHEDAANDTGRAVDNELQSRGRASNSNGNSGSDNSNQGNDAPQL
ncbi:YDG domain-containing protein, partial [Caballeronia sp. ASUFL_F2_KS49]|uniref:beta strand repeat-containing protein n=1 Tax=Caballeronia sp. ASUFL_F2_KS49 TaxID=2921773 RepID=UPI002028DAA6